MGKLHRSARGVMVDMDLLAIKAQLAAQPTPKVVEDRKRALAAKNGVKTDIKDDLGILAVGVQAAEASASAAVATDKPKTKTKP